MIYNILSVITILFYSLIGIYVYFNDKNNKINRFFLLFSFSAVLWIFINLLVDISTSLDNIELLSRITIIASGFVAYFLYKISTVFPKVIKISRNIEFLNKICLLIIVLLTPTHFNIKYVYLLDNGIPAIEPGILYYFLLVYFTFVIIVSYKNFFTDYKYNNNIEKRQVQYVSLGLGISLFLGLISDLILPLFNNSYFVNFGPYFSLFFIIFTSYAIIKLKLFDIKIVTTQIFVFSIWIFVFVRLLISENSDEQIIDGSLLLLLVIFGIFLIKSVIKEVSQREKIELLATDLQKANARLTELDKQKSEFVSFATHQLRAPLTAMKGYASLILEGDMGVISDDVKNAIVRIYESSGTLTNIVDDYLNISRIELGSMKYSFEKIDLKNLVGDVMGELKPNIEKSKLDVNFDCDKNKKYTVKVDPDKFKQIIINIIDNSMKYTPKGKITVSLELNAGKVLFSVKDTGIGIAPEVLPKLFMKFSRATNGSKQNIHGTGLGLFVAKEIVAAHKGKIWAESPGEGKGSSFYVEVDQEI